MLFHRWQFQGSWMGRGIDFVWNVGMRNGQDRCEVGSTARFIYIFMYIIHGICAPSSPLTTRNINQKWRDKLQYGPRPKFCGDASLLPPLFTSLWIGAWMGGFGEVLPSPLRGVVQKYFNILLQKWCILVHYLLLLRAEHPCEMVLVISMHSIWHHVLSPYFMYIVITFGAILLFHVLSVAIVLSLLCDIVCNYDCHMLLLVLVFARVVNRDQSCGFVSTVARFIMLYCRI